jgi:hypothetical protein
LVPALFPRKFIGILIAQHKNDWILERALFPLWIIGGTDDDLGALGEVYGGSADR